MHRVLVNAYACSPEMGSEPGMGWNWCVHLAKYCELHIITEGEFRDKIERTVPTLAQGANIHFYYLPVTEKIRRMCWNQGDWRFYYYYRQWQKRALEKGMEICASQHIDVIHQLNMIGFREPGLLWKINGPKYVWGPIGGLIDIPVNYLWKSDKKQAAKTLLKKSISALQIRFSPNVRRAIQRADVLIGSSNSETETIRRLYGKDVIQMNETCTTPTSDIRKHEYGNGDSFDIVWVGRFILTKQLELALRTMALLNELLQIKLHVLGTGQDEKKYRDLASSLSIDNRCIWHGQMTNQEVQQMMSHSDLFFFTSIAEATSTVVLEAISNQLPILCFDAFGFASIVDERIGIKVPLTNPEQSVKDFAEKIEYLYHHREVLVRMSENCQKRVEELSWDNKAKKMYELYLNENVRSTLVASLAKNVNENVNSREFV